MDMKFVCKQCGNELQEDDLFCPYCGHKAELTIPQTEDSVFCTECGAKNSVTELSCSSCGAKLNTDQAELEKEVESDAPVNLYNGESDHSDEDESNNTTIPVRNAPPSNKLKNKALFEKCTEPKDDISMSEHRKQPSETTDTSTVDPYDEWMDESGVDPYDEYDEPEEEKINPVYRFFYSSTLKWIFTICICVFLIVIFGPDISGYFTKDNSQHGTVPQGNDEINLISSTMDVHTTEPTVEPTATPTPSPTATPTPAPITHVTATRSSYIHARSDASTLVIGELKEGEYIKFEGTKTTGADGYVWYKVEHNGKYGWVSSKCTELARENEVPLNRNFDYSCVIEYNDCTTFFYWDDYYGEFELYEEDGYDDGYDYEYEVERSIYTTGDVNMRSGPSKAHEIIATIKNDTIVTYLDECSIDERGVMWYLVVYNGREGWVSSKYAVLG